MSIARIAPFMIIPMPQPGHQMCASRLTRIYFSITALGMLHHPFNSIQDLPWRNQQAIMAIDLRDQHVATGDLPHLVGDVAQVQLSHDQSWRRLGDRLDDVLREGPDA